MALARGCPVIEMLDSAVESTAANLAFGVIVLAILGTVLLLVLFTSALIRYSVRRIRRWFVENVLIPKMKAEGRNHGC
jgi:hypothetical protein